MADFFTDNGTLKFQRKQHPNCLIHPMSEWDILDSKLGKGRVVPLNQYQSGIVLLNGPSGVAILGRWGLPCCFFDHTSGHV